MLERRQERRGRTSLGGSVAFNNRWSTMECLVRNMSSRGARLEFAEPAFLPDDLDLIIPLRGDSRRVRIVWREQRSVGVAFVAQDSATVIPIETAREIRKLKDERDALARRVRQLTDTLT